MNNQQPFLSIVIANYNYGHLLPAALESIITQDCSDYEIIVIDGGSKDNSVEVIKQYENYIAWWVSEPDKGQSNAFNKGFIHSKGKFLTWLNADDLLMPGTIREVKRRLNAHPEAKWATGNFVRFLHKNGIVLSAPWGPHWLPKWLQGPGRVTVSFGPTTFWSREIFDKLGLIDESLHYAMDIDYWYRINMAGYKQVRVNHTCWGFRMHESSKTAEFGEHEKTDNGKIALQKEKRYIIEKNNYHPKLFWRYTGLFMRFIDGSMAKALLNKLVVVGSDIKKRFHINYDILLEGENNKK